ncbi:NAD(P)/FAD-dependent oxidoreductase [Lachnospiraceae bacterium 62-35]
MAEFDYDVVIIGGGVTGSSIARSLSRYDMKICLVEKEEDVCSGTSKANSAIVHAGFDAEYGSAKARFNVDGNRMMEKLSKELDFEFKRNGSLVLCFSEKETDSLKILYEKGVKNGVEGLSIISGDEARKMEPNLSEHVAAALYAPTGGIVCPFGFTIAMAENAYENGVEFKFETAVEKIEKLSEGYSLETTKGKITSKFVVNAAGVYSDIFHNMVSARKIHIVPRRGDYCLLDKEAGSHVTRTIFQLPGKYGKGILVTPTVHGNLLIGPTAIDMEDKESTATTAEGIKEVIEKSEISVKNIPLKQVITSFSGLRAHEDSDDFIIGEVEDAAGFFDAAGIESPGLSAAPAIGEYIGKTVGEKAGASLKKDFKNERKGTPRLNQMDYKERAELIRQHPEYGIIVCRCEEISEGEIIDAIRRPLGAVSMDGIKRRVRAGMGRCQAGFCTPRVMEILARERGISMEEIRKNSKGSELLVSDGQ